LDDVDICQGKVRQQTADKTATLLMDVALLFPQDLCISTIKNKLSLFELITDDADEVTIQCDFQCWFVSNNKTVFRFAKSNPSSLQTRYIPDDKFDAALSPMVSDDKLIYNINLQERNDVHKKIKKVCDSFSSDKIMFNVEDDKIEMVIESVDKKNRAVIFKEKNDGKIKNKYSIIVRSSFVDKLDSKNVDSMTFFDGVDGKSVTRSVCSVEENLKLQIYAFCKCDKK